MVGTALSWSPAFREAMGCLCQARGMAGPTPPRVGTAIVKSEGLILLWPAGNDESTSVPVSSSPRVRRVSCELAEALGRFGAGIPPGIVVEVPFVPYHNPTHGNCLALQLTRATFLYKRSRGSAIGLLDGE